MKTKKTNRFLCLLVSVTMVFTMLSAMSITAYAAPTIEQFAGGSGTGYAAGDNVPSGVTTLYTQSALVISFDARNGETIADATTGENGKITLPTAPTWNDYTFAGWYTGIDGMGTAVTVDTVYSSSTKVYAKWTKDNRTVRTENLDLTGIVVAAPEQGWTWDVGTKTLAISGIIYDASKLPGRQNGEILLPEGGIMIVTGKNSITGRGTGDTEGPAVIGKGEFTIKGTGTLDVSGQTSAIMVEKGIFTISGVTINVEARKVGGIAIGAVGKIIINENAVISAKGLTSAIMGLEGIFAENATVTGAKEAFTSGTTKDLTQSGVAPVTVSFAPPPLPTFNVDYDIVGGTGSGNRLEGSLDKVVTDPNGGITAADKAAGNSVSLKLTIAEKTAVSTPDSEKIEGIKQGDSVQYYDVKVEKIVTPSSGSPTITKLTSIPKPVRAIIPVPTAIQGKTSYTVYRVHNSVAEKIPNDPTAPEFYSVNESGTSLTLHVKNFSTYAVITGNKALTGDATNLKSSAVDVQGKVLEGMFGIYKLDVSWGAMKFDYNATGAAWNPDSHSYIPGSGTKGWTKESFETGNNKITVTNHSNGDVTLSYLAKPDAVLAGATMTVRSTNSLQGIEANNLLLAKVPTETAAAPTIDTYVWMTGEPTNLAGLNDKSYTKAGVITITAEADTTSGLTPKNP